MAIWLKNKFVNWVLKDILFAVDPTKIISVKEQELSDGKINRTWYLNSEKMTDQTLKILKEEAAYIKRTELWAIFQNRIADTARQKMFERAENFDDMMWGKAMLYNLKVQKDIIDKLLE